MREIFDSNSVWLDAVYCHPTRNYSFGFIEERAQHSQQWPL
jgi:hypothetical protein